MQIDLLSLADTLIPADCCRLAADCCHLLRIMVDNVVESAMDMHGSDSSLRLLKLTGGVKGEPFSNVAWRAGAFTNPMSLAMPWLWKCHR